jgi:undecaprenyl-diphosphatase
VTALYAHDPFLALRDALLHPWLDRPMLLLSLLGELWAVALLAGAGVLWLDADRRRGARTVATLGAALLVVAAALSALKHLVASARPAAVLGVDRVRVLLDPTSAGSFPSGHAAVAAALAVVLSSAYGRGAAPAWMFAFLCGVSRLYVGAHWATDVVCGWAVGALAAAAVCAAIRLAASTPGQQRARVGVPLELVSRRARGL